MEIWSNSEPWNRDQKFLAISLPKSPRAFEYQLQMLQAEGIKPKWGYGNVASLGIPRPLAINVLGTIQKKKMKIMKTAKIENHQVWS